jgi:hypothetical protein
LSIAKDGLLNNYNWYNFSSGGKINVGLKEKKLKPVKYLEGFFTGFENGVVLKIPTY